MSVMDGLGVFFIWGCGGTGRHGRLKICCSARGVRVRIPPSLHALISFFKWEMLKIVRIQTFLTNFFGRFIIFSYICITEINKLKRRLDYEAVSRRHYQRYL